MTTELRGKAIVVTGAGAGLGRSYVLALVRAGAWVVINDVDERALRSVADEVAELGGNALSYVGSVANWDQAATMVESCVKEYGTIDGLVSNAAVHHAASPLQETEAGVRRIVEVNVLGSLFPALHAFRLMAAQGHGKILNVTSGAHIGLLGMTAYGTTKGAVASLTYNLSLEAAKVGVQVNALAPVAQTAMSPVQVRGDGVSRPQPDRIAPVVVYLMSDAAHGVHGQVIRYDGTSLSLLEQPHFGSIRATEDIDTPEGIARAFASTLADRFSPVGLY